MADGTGNISVVAFKQTQELDPQKLTGHIYGECWKDIVPMATWEKAEIALQLALPLSKHLLGGGSPEASWNFVVYLPFRE